MYHMGQRVTRIIKGNRCWDKMLGGRLFIVTVYIFSKSRFRNQWHFRPFCILDPIWIRLWTKQLTSVCVGEKGQPSGVGGGDTPPVISYYYYITSCPHRKSFCRYLSVFVLHKDVHTFGRCPSPSPINVYKDILSDVFCLSGFASGL